MADFNIFGTAPESLAGLLGEQATKDLQRKAMTTGLINTALGYLVQPKNQNLGLGRIIGQSLMSGMTGAQGVYSGALEDWQTKQKIAELQRTQKQQAAQDLFRSRIGQPNATRDIFTQETAQVPVAQGIEAPNYQTQMQAPTVTKLPYFDPKVMINEALQSGALPFDKYLELSSKETKPRDTTIAPNGQLIYKDTGELVTQTSFAAPEKPLSMTDESTRVSFAKFGKPLNQLNPKEMQEVNNYIENSRVRVAGAGVPSQQPGFKDATSLRQEFKNDPVIKAFNTSDSAYKIIKSTMTSVSPAGDLAGVTKFMKILDPDSVVRESEVGMAKNATGLYDKLSNYYAQVTKGTVLTEPQRKDFLDTATKFYDIAKQQKADVENQYADIAKTGGLDPKLVIGNPSSKTSNNVIDFNSLPKSKKAGG